MLEVQGGKIWAIEIKRGLAPRLDRGFHHARMDLEPGYKSQLRNATYTVSHGAQQFLMIRSFAGSGQLIWVQNFFEELKAKVGN